MNWKGKLDSRRSFCALAGPVVHAFSQCSWPAAIFFAGVTWALRRCLGGVEEKVPAWVSSLREVWQVLAAVTIMNWLTFYWPSLRNEAVAISAVTLAAYAAAKGRQTTGRAWGVAWYAVILLVGSVLISAAPMVKRENLTVWMQPGPMADAAFASFLLFALPHGNALLLAPAAAICATGVLGVSAGQAAFYELSRNIRLFGTVPRFESLAAAAMTVSFAVTLTELIDSPEEKTDWKKTLLKGMLTASVWYLGVEIPAEYLTIGCIILWIVPKTIFFQKKQKM